MLWAMNAPQLHPSLQPHFALRRALLFYILYPGSIGWFVFAEVYIGRVFAAAAQEWSIARAPLASCADHLFKFLPTFGLSLPLFPCAFCVFWNGLFDDLRVFDKWCTSLNPDTAQHVILHTQLAALFWFYGGTARSLWSVFEIGKILHLMWICWICCGLRVDGGFRIIDGFPRN
jgi:hypothetical protein